MSDAISENNLESIPALNLGLAGGADSRQQNQSGQQGGAQGGANKSTGGADLVKLSQEAQAQLQKLQSRDREVRAHEQAHIAAGGQ